MPPIPPQQVQINCPNCGTTYQTDIHTIVDVAQQPELKQALLSGRLNAATCPNCGYTALLGAPLAYHDAEKQLYMVYIPQELNLGAEDQERLIGEHTSVLMQVLPPDAPRSHLLMPKRIISMPSLIDAILEADGVPREVLEQQRQRVDLISQFAQALTDENQFQRLIEQHRALLTHEFFATIDAFINTSAQEGQEESRQMLLMLRQKLADAAGYTGAPPEGEAPDQQDDHTQEILLDSLSAVDDEGLDALIGDVLPSLDYSFFEAWTARIEALQAQGKADEAQRLTDRRAHILATVERMNAEGQAMYEAGTRTLRAVMEAEDRRAALQAAHASSELNEAFMLVLSANVSAAQRSGQSEIVAELEEINRMAVEVVQESLPADERLINDLMMAPSPQESTALLRSNAALVTTDFVKKLNELADEQQQQGAKQYAEQLRRLAREAGAMLF